MFHPIEFWKNSKALQTQLDYEEDLEFQNSQKVIKLPIKFKDYKDEEFASIDDFENGISKVINIEAGKKNISD